MIKYTTLKNIVWNFIRKIDFFNFEFYWVFFTLKNKTIVKMSQTTLAEKTKNAHELLVVKVCFDIVLEYL